MCSCMHHYYLLMLLPVAVSPLIIRPPEAATVQAGDPVILTCVSDGIPPPNVTFYFNGEEMKEDDLIQINTTNHIATITKVDKIHEGEYSCRASSVAGSVESDTIRITVFGQFCIHHICHLDYILA